MITREWKWSNGEENIKSPRYYKEEHLTNSINSINSINSTNSTNSITYNETNTNNNNNSQNAIFQSLDGYDSFDFETMFSRNDNSMGKTREDLDDKISNRELIFQRGTNPFLQTTNYVNDVVTRDTFLKPMNTTFEKIKNSEEEK